jgi:hypothetical protein
MERGEEGGESLVGGDGKRYGCFWMAQTNGSYLYIGEDERKHA